MDQEINFEKDVAIIATYLLDGGADPNLCEPIVITIRIVVYTVYTDYSVRKKLCIGREDCLVGCCQAKRLRNGSAAT